MNFNVARQIWVLGLTVDPEKVDGIEFYSYGFLQHDLNHLYNALERKKDIKNGELKGFITEGDEGEVFHEKFEKWLASDIKDKKERLILRVLWHEMFHEYYFPEPTSLWSCRYFSTAWISESKIFLTFEIFLSTGGFKLPSSPSQP